MRSVVEATRGKLFYGWLIVAAAFLISFVGSSAFNHVLALFVKPMSEQFGWTRAEFSAATSIGSLAGGVLIYFFGPFIDRRGPKMVMVVGSAILGLSLISISLVVSRWEFYLTFGIGRAMAVAVLDVAALVAVSNWFLVKRGRAIGLTTLGRRLGFALLPLMVQLLILAWGWRSAWVGLGVTALIFGVVPSVLLVQRRPEDVGLSLDGRSGDPSSQRQDDAPKTTAAARAEDVTWTLATASKTGAFWLIMMTSVMQSLGVGTINLHQFPHLTDVGVSPTSAAGVISTLAIFQGIGAIFSGFIAERLHVKYCTAMAFALSALGVVILMFTSNVGMAYLYAVVFGLGLGSSVPLVSIAWADYFGRTSLGLIQGASRPAQMTAAAVGPFFGGWVFDVTRSYKLAFIVITGAYILGIAFILAAKVPRIAKQESLSR